MPLTRCLSPLLAGSARWCHWLSRACTIAALQVEPGMSTEQSDEPPVQAQRAPLSESTSSPSMIEMQVEEQVEAEAKGLANALRHEHSKSQP